MPTTLPGRWAFSPETPTRRLRLSPWDALCVVALTSRLRRNNRRLERACKAADLRAVSHALADGEDLIERIERRFGC